MKVLNFPLIKITAAFVLGLLVGFYFGINNSYIVFGILLALLLLLFFTYYQTQKAFSTSTYFGIAVVLFSFWAGVTNHFVHQENFRQSHFLHLDNIFLKPQNAEVTVKEKLKSSLYNDRFVVVVAKASGRACTGKLLLNIRKTAGNKKIEVGRKLLINGKIYPHKPANNPDQFDYGKYLSNKYIYAQMYVGIDEIKTEGTIEKSILSYASNFRNTIIHNLEKSNFSKEELNIVIALILGQQQDISKEVLQDYQFAGAVHVLSVSGLHVGFILLFINALLFWLSGNNIGNGIRFVTILVFLWAFAVIAGLSPSVVRSVTMFTFVAAGMFLKRKTNIYQTLTVSILLILMVSPSFLFDVGFQLSYLALFFILWLEPLLAGLWEPKNKVINYFWKILTVSFAAQIGALPISVYYFHQFPGLFFLTNLLVLPALGCIMALGVIVMGMAAFDYVPKAPIVLLEWCIRVLNGVIKWIASFEQFIIKDIPLNFILLITSYLAIVSSIIWFKKPSYKRLIFVLSAIIILQISYFGTRYYNQNQQEWIVLQAKKESLFMLRNGEKVTLYSKDSILKNNKQYRAVQSYLTTNFSTVTKTEPLKNVHYFKNNKILIIDSLGITPAYFKPDIIVVVQSPKVNFDRMLQDYNPKLIIADGSNYKSYVALWERSCEKYKIPFHATAEKGFYKVE
ncbi:MAG TPA: ComEC/Rec2 family competence protein [Flavobacterium sp.]|jgi:competence protein ComEC